MKKFFKSQRGSITLPIGIMIFLTLIFMMIFFVIISKSTVNMVLHEIRSDLYLITKNAVFAIQRDLMGEDISCLYEDELEELIEKGIIKSWNLDDRLRRGKGLIEQAKISEVLVIEDGEQDPITKKVVNELTVHTVIKVKVKLLIFRSLLDDKSEFEFHTDLQINKIKL